MATLKKTTKRKEQAKPSTVLIIFLVFFILLSIGLGVAAYYGYDGQNKLRDDKKNASIAENTMRDNRNYRIAQAYAVSNALGIEFLADAERVLGADMLKDIADENGKYAKEPDRVAFAKGLKELGDELTYVDAEKKFKDTYRAKYATVAKELQDAKSQLAQAKDDLAKEKKKYAEYEAKNETYAQERTKQIANTGAAAFKEAARKFESFNDLVKANKDIQDQKLETDAKLKAKEEELSIEKARFAKFLESLDKKVAGQEIALQKKNGDQHALMLDLSRGIPFWDRPVGKVTRVDLDQRLVYINLGSVLGARPELTFNIFADDGKGNADKFLKGTIEVIRVIDGQTSLCRLTSLYDAAGSEIGLNDPTAGRAAREVQAAIKEGDLIFNMFWNSHVAIAGAVNFTGFPIDAPSEQMRQIDIFTQLLARMGIHTDSLLDLNDGQIKGGISNKTRFLILGDQAMPKNPNDEAQKERAKLINDGIADMKKLALDNGLFLISAENFTIAAGYRKPRNANNTELGKFGATVPFSGTSTPGLVIQRDTPAAGAPMPMPKKEEEKKLPDAKEKEEKK